jgi:uncharacterized protein (TIGR03435 family)
MRRSRFPDVRCYDDIAGDERPQQGEAMKRNSRRWPVPLRVWSAALRRWGALAVLGVVVLGTMAAASAQSVDATSSFEVESVRPNAGTGLFTLAVQPGGRFVATRVRLRELIRFAYEVQPFQIEGRAPSADEMLDRRFDVMATAPGGELPPIRPGVVGVVNRMVQQLLVDRFTLQLQPEKKQMDVYELVLARNDGQRGKQMLNRTAECESGATPARSGESAGAIARNAGEKPAEQLTRLPCGRSNLGAGLMLSGGIAMTQFTQTLTNLVGRGVLDKTGLPGIWAFQLKFAPLQPVGAGATTSPDAAPASTDPDRPSIFTALREQLGLELRPARDPVDVLVVAEVSEPTPN